jgi:hypothetical protein
MGGEDILMKHIGFTTEGNDLVEVSKEEYSQFVKLKIAVEGGDGLPFYSPHNHARIDFDFTKTFEVIFAWWSGGLRIREMQTYLGSLKSSLDRVSDDIPSTNIHDREDRDG